MSWGHRRLLAWLLAAALGCFAWPAQAATPPVATDGVLDLSHWDFDRDGIAALDGQWQFVPGQLVGPQEPWPANARWQQVPGNWAPGLAAAHGTGSYRLRIACNAAQPLALALPFQHTAATVFVNGRAVGNQGQPGLPGAGHRPEIAHQFVPLDGIACPLELRAQVSNHEFYRGGLMRSMQLGTRAALTERRELALMRSLLALGAIVVVGVFSLMFYLGRRRERLPLYFGVFSLSFGIALGLSGERALQPLVAWMGFDAQARLLFANWAFGLPVYALLMRGLFPAQVSRRAARAFLTAGVAGALAAFVLPFSALGYAAPLLQAAAVVVVAYVAWVLWRAWHAGARGVPVVAVGLGLLIATAAHDVVFFQHLLSASMLPYGIAAFVLAPGVLLAQRLAQALSSEEQQASEQRARAELLVRATQAGVLDWDAVSGEVRHSERYLEMLGFSGAPAPPPFRALLHPEDHDRVHGSFLAQLRDRSGRGLRRGAPADYRMVRADGEPIWVHAEAISVCGADGRTLRYICTFMDITGLKATEQALRAQMEITRTEQRRLDLVVLGARVGIVDWDGRTHATYYSPRFREIRGYAPDADTDGWPDYFKVMIHPDDRERVTRRWTAFVRGKGPEGPRGEYYAPEEYRLLRAGGDYLWVQVSGMAVRDDGGFVVRWIAAIIDISERRAQAELLERQNEALKENVRLREEVERIGRHDLKTPLNSIVAVPRLLREERKLGPEADELLGIVERAGYRILSMVNLSTDLYKMEQGRYIFRPDAVDLAALAQKVVADVRMHAASKQVRLQVQAWDAPLAWAEELLCYSLMANLLKNAVEAAPEGGTVSLAIQGAPGETVLLRIHNQGAVPAAIRGSFFEKYTTLGKASGTGLGTYSARLMARVQDGDIAMETSDESGTTLTVRLRAAPANAAPASVRHSDGQHGADTQRVSALPPMRVLLVDDDEYNLLIVRRFLPVPPFTVDIAINGRVALAAVQLQWPDLVLMDLDMPVMGGMEAVGRMRAHQRAAMMPPCTIIALSSHDDEDTRQRALAAGFDRYLTKPVTREAIHAVLLALHTVGDGLPAPAAAPAAVEQAGAGPTDEVVLDADVQALLPEFLASRHVLLDQLDAAAAAGDREELRRLAHQLAGSLGLYGYAWAGERSRWLEKNAHSVEAGAVRALSADLRGHLQTVPVRFAGSEG